MHNLPRSRKLRYALVAGVLALTFLSTCLFPSGGTPEPVARSHPWAEALRALDPADASTPSNDLTAVYLRENHGNLQIRVDLLDFQGPGGISLDIRIGDDVAPESTPLDIHVPSESESNRVSLDLLLATVIVDIPLSDVPTHPRVDVSTPEDEITGLTLNGTIPPKIVPLLLTFYDTFAARFPAEALRSWDGAHTGPHSERHGLKHLLEAVEEYQVPVVLLDLKEPENLSALDAMGLLPRIHQMEQEGLLILPDQPGQELLFEFSPSPFSWGGLVAKHPRKGATRPTFVLSDDPSHLYQPLLSKTILIPIAGVTEASQPTSNGPSLEVRRALLEAVLNADEKDLLVLGGSLRDSTWGSPDMVSATLAYFASRPYIQILNAETLQSFPTKFGKPEIQPHPLDGLVNELETHYKNLTQPVLDFAENWDGSPLSNCDNDLDQDGRPECTLANGGYLAILDPQGARVTYLFAVGRDGIPPYYQFIGPSWQVAVGLSNPSTWNLSAGEAADSGAYPGAFADTDDPFKPYQPTIEEDVLTFRSIDGTRTKIFRLTETSLEVEYQTYEPVTTQIPLLVDPWTRFTPDWVQKYTQQNTPGGVAWGLANGPKISLHIVSVGETEGLITMRGFDESLSLLTKPEDPNLDYPPGHYIPFPMAIAKVEMKDGYFLRLELFP